MTEMIRRNCVKIRSTFKVNKYSAFPFLEYGKKKKNNKKTAGTTTKQTQKQKKGKTMIKLHTGNKNKTIPFVTGNLSGHSTKDRQKKHYYY